jgi:mannose-6-phosphate isomerase-like protein (cupin superfamily)
MPREKEMSLNVKRKETPMKMPSCLTPIQLRPDEDNVVSPLGFDVSVTAHRQEREAAYSLIEFKRPTGREDLPAQVHDEVEEGLYILEGQATITVGHQEIKGPAGTFVCIPPGVAHRIHNTGTGPMTLLLIATPGSLKQFLEELSDCMETAGDPSPLEVLVFFLLLHLVE